LCSGFVTGVAWQNAGPPPSRKPTAPVTIAVGNNSVEALTALVTQQATAAGTQVQPELFAAFQFNLLGELDKPDGPTLLAETLRSAAL
jgi:hypothetical protein